MSLKIQPGFNTWFFCDTSQPNHVTHLKNTFLTRVVVIPAPKRLRQEDHYFKAKLVYTKSLGPALIYTVRP